MTQKLHPWENPEQDYARTLAKRRSERRYRSLQKEDFKVTMKSYSFQAELEIIGINPFVAVPPDILQKIFQDSGREKSPIPICGLSVTTNNLSETNWAEAWKKYFEPARITHDLTIVPSWTEDYVATGSEKLIRLDPGMAFGTGTHPTTKMSLYALEQVLRGGETLLDVGTGSGVLSVGASYLGAAEIFAYDIDEVAVRVALENIELNHWS
uniref:ETFB lysine methyltransferase n=1 Tax=Timema monikensis TaxID=170555 RepID=A0A7R9EC26_9NEOP|nr:unnamed protein product [Timema monikensis]